MSLANHLQAALGFLLYLLMVPLFTEDQVRMTWNCLVMADVGSEHPQHSLVRMTWNCWVMADGIISPANLSAVRMTWNCGVTAGVSQGDLGGFLVRVTLVCEEVMDDETPTATTMLRLRVPRQSITPSLCRVV